MSDLISATALSKRFMIRCGFKQSELFAVDAVDLTIADGECVGLVGESGCGKSTLARLVAGLIEPTSGTLAIDAPGDPRAAVQVVFQDPNECLNPGMTAYTATADPIRRLTKGNDRAAIRERVDRAFDDVGLPRELGRRYPHQLSGGQKARVGIARAIAVEPKLLILDEPTSALDVSVQAVILKLLGDLKARTGMSYLFVSHDLDVVRLISDRVAVMYLGRIVETGPTRQVFAEPGHPYTRALLAGSPDPALRGLKTQRLAGSASSPIDPDPNACRFAGRCPMTIERCRTQMPQLVETRPGHFSACHRRDELAAPSDPSTSIPTDAPT